MAERAVNGRVLVLIVTYNGMTWIDRCLIALRTSCQPVTTLVVDNASTDGTVARIQSTYPEVLLRQSSVNLGFGQANNIGLRSALEQGYDYVFMINQDVYIYPDTIGNLLRAVVDSEVGIYTPLQLNADGRDLDKHFRDCVHYDMAPGLIAGALTGNLQPSYESYMTYAAAWFLPVSTLSSIGGFDPIFFHYGEDVHYTSRVLYHGLTMRLVPAAKIRHDRIEVGNMQMYNHRRILRSFRNAYLDVTRQKNWWRTFPHLRTWLSSLQGFCHGRWRAPFEVVGAYLSIIWHRRELTANRATNRRPGPNWL